MSSSTRRPSAGLLLPILFLTVFAFAGTVSAATLYGVTTGNNLVRFDSSTPNNLTTIGPVTGLPSGENVVGIDVRPATGDLIALTNAGRLYQLNRITAAATFVATLSTPLSGTEFAVDFNPTVDRLRVVSNTGQNLRINPNNGATTVDGNINPGSPQVTAAAYTNSFNGTTTTTLYVIDTITDQLFIQNPPNNGTLVLVGPLGVDVGGINGFDIFPGDGIAYLAATPSVGIGAPVLFTVNLTTGSATSIGNIGGPGNTTGFRGLTADAATGTAAMNFTVIGLTATNQLVRFNSNRPNTLLGGPVAITGLASGENILGIDFRPANGRLYGLGSSSRLYVIDVATGAATAVGTAGAFTLTGTDFGFDFNPTVDRIRIVSNTGQNLRINPNDGTLTATDTPLNPGTPQVTAAAYTNSFAGSTTTTLYDIDSGNDTLYIQNPPNAGTLVPVGPLGVDIGPVNGFDIGQTSSVGLIAAQAGASSSLYIVNLATGSAAFAGPIGAAGALRGIAIRPGSAASRTVDFDGDGRTDYSVFRPTNNIWYINNSSSNTFTFTQFGLTGDAFTPGDYDSDGRDDISVWRSGIFYALRSGSNTVSYYQFGVNGDEPVARDNDGDGRTDYAVVRRTGGQMIWYINNSSNNSFRIEQFGLEQDVTAPGDYDGDGRFDLATYRGINGQPGVYFVNASTLGFSARALGVGGDLIVPGDYDGDGKTDYAFLRRSSQYQWIIVRSSDNSFNQIALGTQPHVPTQGDYDGDGRTDVSVWDPSSGTYFTYRTFNGALLQYRFGVNGDIPIAGFDTH